MDNLVTELGKMVAVNFATWIEKNNWLPVSSESLQKKAYVDSGKHSILTFGSDLHYTELIKNHGKSLEELYDLFIEDEKKRLQEKYE